MTYYAFPNITKRRLFKMKTNKKFYAFMLSLAMMLSAISPAFAAVVNYGDELTNMPNKNYTQKFSDVPASYWAFNYIAEMAERNVLSGYPDGKFYPNNNVTRAEFAKIMTAAAGLKISIGYSSYEDVDYTDWCSPYIEAARYYLSGYVSNGKSYYMPNNNALREDIAVALVKLKGYDTTGFDLSLLQTMFSDWKSISTGAQPYVAVAVEQELISGYDDGTFKGQQGITRAEAATLLWRAYQYGNNNKDFEQEVIETPKPTKEPEPTVAPIKEPEKEVVKPTTAPEPEETQEPEKTEEPVKTPEPKTYGWKVSTIKNGIDNVDTIQAVPNGVAFSDGNKVYELNDNGKLTTIFDADEYPYQGTDELSKRTKVSNELKTFAYNRNDGNIYAIVEQDPSDNKGYFLYNITLDESIELCATKEFYEFNQYYPVLLFYENGDISLGTKDAVGHRKFSPDGKEQDSSYEARTICSFLMSKNKSYTCSGRGGGNTIIDVDCDDPEWSSLGDHWYLAMPGYNKFYRMTSDLSEITTLDINGDAGFLLAFDDIENEEGRSFDLNKVIQYGAITDDESKLYFYDNAYGSIRVIKRNK